jgi:ectoine hydroxylase-related dioxygenase (phytanoyl-CoA dioxygenase family)
MELYMGKSKLVMGSEQLIELRDSNDIVNDVPALQRRMEVDGYLLIRGFHRREEVLAARREFLHKLESMGRLAPNTAVDEGIIQEDNKNVSYQGPNLEMPALLNVVNSPKIMHFFEDILGGPCLTYDYKWARAVAQAGFTGSHYDVVYMGRGTRNLYTVWTPLGDVPYESGPLALCQDSQHFQKVKDTYGRMDVDRDNVVGWFSEDPLEILQKFGGKWATTSFQAGDILIFGMFMLHGSLTNMTNRYRLSVDTRYQLASEPVDERWYGTNAKGHYAWNKGKTVSMESARKQWGV